MNILPKKRWHVRNKDNIARVLRDEKRAAEEEEKALRRKTLAEQEARLNHLRSKRSDQVIQFENPEKSDAPKEHVNLFYLEEQGLKTTDATNEEHEKEKKAENEEFEKKIGLLTYLGGSVTESNGSVPWYVDRSKKEASKTERQQRDRMRIVKEDPFHHMSKSIDDIKRKRPTDEQEKSPLVKQSKSSSLSRIEQLRADRLKREAAERSKAESYLSRVFTGKDSTTEESVKKSSSDDVEIDDRKRRYNSQFNPDLAKKNTTYATTHDFNWRQRY